MPAPGTFTDVAILSTTDMHGKCWNTNILTGAAENNNMLRVSTAVKQFRQEYGAENVLLIDNGDLFQGTPVSQVQLLMRASGESTDQPAMAVCLKEIGYDAFVLGNHEFNYPWDIMSDTYRWLEENGIPVLAANACYDGSDPAHEAGENVLTPYVIKTINVNGHEHKIGILGLENVDITRWDLPVNYPGIRFVHPGNDEFSNAREAELYLPRMKEEGCEFIIVSYHGGIGDTDISLFFGANTESQGMRMIAETEGIDFLIAGHDHSTGYSNTFISNAAGKEVPLVNGGGQDLTKTIFRFSEDTNGTLQWQMLSSENLQLRGFDTDSALEEKIRPVGVLAVCVREGIARGQMQSESCEPEPVVADPVNAGIHQGESAERVGEKPDGRGEGVLEEDVVAVLGACETGFHAGESEMHQEDEHAARHDPQVVDREHCEVAARTRGRGFRDRSRCGDGNGLGFLLGFRGRFPDGFLDRDTALAHWRTQPRKQQRQSGERHLAQFLPYSSGRYSGTPSWRFRSEHDAEGVFLRGQQRGTRQHPFPAEPDPRGLCSGRMEVFSLSVRILALSAGSFPTQAYSRNGYTGERVPVAQSVLHVQDFVPFRKEHPRRRARTHNRNLTVPTEIAIFA